MNNNKKHRTPGPLGSNPADMLQQRTRGPLGHDFDIHQVAACTPGPTGHNEGATLHKKAADSRLRELKQHLRHLAKELREKGVDWAKDTALDVAFDQLKDKGLDVLKKLVFDAEWLMKLPAAATDLVGKIVKANQKMSEEWVKANDPGVERVGASQADAMARVAEKGGMVFQLKGEEAWYWSKDPNYQPNSASIAVFRANSKIPSQPIPDAGNGKRDGRPTHFGRIVLKLAIVEFAIDQGLDMIVEGGAESHSPLSKWAKKTVLQFEKKFATDEFEKLLTEAAAHKGHHHHAAAPSKPSTPPGKAQAGAAGAPPSFQVGQQPDQSLGANENDIVIKPNK